MLMLHSSARHRDPEWSGALRRFALRWLVPSLAVVLFVVAMGMSAAQTATSVPATEASVKAAYLYKFLGYAELPPASAGTPRSPMVIGVIGAAGIAADLTRITTGRAINGRSIEVRILRETDPVDDLQAVFIGLKESTRLSRLLELAQQRSILTVTDGDGALDLGSVINFRTVDDRVRFEVSLVNSERAGIKLSSRMLAVALRVDRGAP